jgi:transcriptional regulator with XRE-family HTH domain
MSSEKIRTVENIQLGRKYRAQRILLGLNQNQVGLLVGVTQYAISLFERGFKQSEKIKGRLDHLYLELGYTDDAVKQVKSGVRSQ